MPVRTHIHVRDARDRLIDLLGIGKTYPLRDLAVRDEQLTVPFNTAAKIPIETSQPGVLYLLHDTDNQLVKRVLEEEKQEVAVETEGNGQTILLETPKTQEDITFKILARKLESGLEVYLHQTATVKVGLDTRLNAWILDVPWLDPSVETPKNTDPRIVDYGISVKVEIEHSQEGVDYRLVSISEGKEEIIFSEDEVRGNLGNIVLQSKPPYEDTDIRIRATKTFDPSENRESQTDLLDVVLLLKVRANPAMQVSVDPAPLIGYKQDAIIKIADTQRRAKYRLYLRTIPDRDFVHRAVPGSEVLKVSVQGEPDVQIRKPERPEVWQEPEDYQPMGDFQAGSGGELQTKINALTGDSLIIIQAVKEHQAAIEDQFIQSAVQLEQAAAVLVHPDPVPALRLRVPVAGEETAGTTQVFDGQPGVFYYFRLDPEGNDLGLPAYFHKRDDRDKAVNKGLGQLKLEVDLVVAVDLPTSKIHESTRLAEVPPEPPLLETGRLPTDTTLHIRAVKAQTRVATSLDHIAQIPSGPEAHPEEAVVDHGAKTRIRIKASRAKEWYQLLLNGNPVGEAIEGTGSDLFLKTGELEEDTAFELLVIQPDEPIVVERVLGFTVLVRPDTTLSVTAIASEVEKNAATEIRVDASQLDVRYQLLADGKPIGNSVDGNGDAILLLTGPITEDTTFVIRATRITDTDISVELDQQVSVAVLSNL